MTPFCYKKETGIAKRTCPKRLCAPSSTKMIGKQG
jgi:hypothetical protein